MQSTAASLLELDPDAEELLLVYHWPGNVRQLENVITRAHILSDGNRITVGDLPADVARAVPPPSAAGKLVAKEGPLRDQMRQFEADIIQRTLDDAGGDRRLAAQRLGIGLSSLYRKLEEYESLGMTRSGAENGVQSH
jgi:DNA-binding NtrC family response regulator